MIYPKGSEAVPSITEPAPVGQPPAVFGLYQPHIWDQSISRGF